jgi:hypothetical protein
LPDGQITWFREIRFVQSFSQKYFALSEAQISRMLRSVLTPFRGAYRDRHGRWVEDAMDALAQLTNARPVRTAKA